MSGFLIDRANNKKYTIGKHLGSGAFGTCFRVTDQSNQKLYACKKIRKQCHQENHQKEEFQRKLQNETNIHSKLKHKNVVYYHYSFQDDFHHYTILELCGKGSMMELLIRRKFLTNPEVKYYLRQVIEGVIYLHENNIVHRDLKPGNLFISDDMSVKIGDFSLAVALEDLSQRRYSLCGTPNYVAPEIVDMAGHGFEVDVWAIGCIIFFLLEGKPPFMAKDEKETIRNVKKCSYTLSSKLDGSVRDLLKNIFVYDPFSRPTVEELLQKKYFKEGFVPKSLPVSALHVAPSFYDECIPQSKESNRKALKDINENILNNQKLIIKNTIMGKENKIQEIKKEKKIPKEEPKLKCIICKSYDYLPKIKKSIYQILSCKLINQYEKSEKFNEEFLSVARWMNHGDANSSFGYNLTDGRFGALFSDSTHLTLINHQYNYISTNGQAESFTDCIPQNLRSKVQALEFLKNALEKLQWSGKKFKEGKFVFLVDWRRYEDEVFMFLSNGTVQVNFLKEHVKVGINCQRDLIVEIREDKCKMYSIDLMKECGCEKSLREKLKFIFYKLDDFYYCRGHGKASHM